MNSQNKYPEHAVDFIWFSEKKLFTIATPRNSQNDRLYVHSAVKKRDVAGRRLLSTRPTFSRSVMVSVAVSTLGCTDIHFLEPGVKVSGEYYRNTVLCNMLLPDIGAFLATGTFSSKIVRQHIELALPWISWKEKRQSSFRRYCAPNSPDLNPVDYSVWSILQENVYKTRITEGALKTREWKMQEWKRQE